MGTRIYIRSNHWCNNWHVLTCEQARGWKWLIIYSHGNIVQRKARQRRTSVGMFKFHLWRKPRECAPGTVEYSTNVRWFGGLGASPGLRSGATNSGAARIARKRSFFPREAAAVHACACVPWTRPLPPFPPPSASFASSLSAGRRAGAGCKSIAARRWSGRAEIARWAGLNGGSARVLNTSYLADRWVLRLPLAQLVACWLVGSDLHWRTLGSWGTGGAWTSISRYATQIRRA